MITFRKATAEDAHLYFEWVNDDEVRAQSFISDTIDFSNHEKWFVAKLKDPKCLMLLFINDENKYIGQIRIQEQDNESAIIGVSIAKEHRGKGYSKEMLMLASDFFLKQNQTFELNAYIKESNLNSKYAFENAGFQFIDIIKYQNFKSFHYLKKLK